jgi:hypothetical protein
LRIILGALIMTGYRIKEIGKAFVVGTDEQDILVCADRDVAQQISNAAEHRCINNLPRFLRPEAKKNPLA